MTFYSDRLISYPDLSVEVNGFEVPTILSRNAKIYQLIFDIPPLLMSKVDGFCEIRFELSSVFCPADKGGKDIRQLGICVSAISFERLF